MRDNTVVRTVWYHYKITAKSLSLGKEIGKINVISFIHSTSFHFILKTASVRNGLGQISKQGITIESINTLK